MSLQSLNLHDTSAKPNEGLQEMSSHQRPALIPLDNQDFERDRTVTRANSLVLSPRSNRENLPPPQLMDLPLAVSRQGRLKKHVRVRAFANHDAVDLEEILDVIEGILSLNNNTWTVVANRFNRWAADYEKLTHQQVSHTEKLTGTGERPITFKCVQDTQILSLSHRLRAVQGQLEVTRTQLAICERERNAADRRADRAELREMFQRDRRSQMGCSNPLVRARRSRHPVICNPTAYEVNSEESDDVNEPPKRMAPNLTI